MSVEPPNAHGNLFVQTNGKVVSFAQRIPLLWRRVLLIAWDCFSWVLALVLFVVVRYDLELSGPQWGWALAYTGTAVSLQLILGLITQVYLGRNRVGSFGEATWIGVLVLLAGIPVGILLPLISSDFPRGIGIVLPPLALVFMAAGRWAFRAITSSSRSRGPVDAGVRTIVYGAGDAGHQVAQLVDKAEDPHFQIVGFVDDDPSARYLRVRKYRVLGKGSDLVDLARRYEVDAVILAISNASPKLIQQLADRCDVYGLELVILPPVREMIGGKLSLDSLRQLNVADLLGRRPVRTDVNSMAGYINSKVVLVTGAGGSIGAELARQLYKLGPKKLVLVDRDESALHGVQLSIYGVGLLDTDDMVLCDIRDYESLRAVFEHHKPDVVFHAAALKHLPMLERFPAEGWKTNVHGSYNVLRCAHEVGTGTVVNVSTDKAADASSVLGRSKRIAERVTSWFAEEYGMRYLSVRFGNVLGSRGSVLHTFRAQIERGGPVTVTHPEVTRYFMTIPEACELVLQAGAIGEPGDVLVLDMGEPVKIVDVAKRLIAESGEDIDINFTGLRHGEKMHEVLFSHLEKGAPSKHPLISHVHVPPLDPSRLPSKRPGREVLKELVGDTPTPEQEEAVESAEEAPTKDERSQSVAPG